MCLRQECVKALASLCDRHRQVLDCGQVLAHGAIAFCCLYTPYCSCISFSMCVCVFVLSGGGVRIEGSRWGWGLQCYENQKEDSWQEERFLVKLVLLLGSFLPSYSHSLSGWFSSSYILTNSILLHHKLLLHFLYKCPYYDVLFNFLQFNFQAKK